jgi:hypothetical protein
MERRTKNAHKKKVTKMKKIKKEEK